MTNKLIIVRGAGDIATGVIHKLNRCGFNVLALEVEKPLSIRRNVCFSEAIYEGEVIIENVKCKFIKSKDELSEAFNLGKVCVAIDPEGHFINELKPKVVIDAIIAKRNLGTHINMAPITIGLGPGFSAGKDVDFVIETMRGHDLGRVIDKGIAIKNTGIPGSINGVSSERVIYSKESGIINNICNIGDVVKKNQVIATINKGNTIIEIKATIDGVLRGIIRNKSKVNKGLKIADIDPRIDEIKNCDTISDKARCIAGGVLEAMLMNWSDI
ncbi:selenium-dependent molybdenum cofactor biosynthesis protein YqeB [Paraclostridium bifermentans]|uniref:selenium-dependent molybdenum cofactor biosynthesis protein YqeB n=1 Tax=Paraclostridium bifermentans TaxID=1490 RepID=UPI00359C416A